MIQEKVKRYKQKPHIVYEIVEDEGVLVHPAHGKMIVLNESGTYLWQVLGDWLTVEELIGQLTAVFDTTTHTAQQDIQQFVTLLNQKGLIDVQTQ